MLVACQLPVALRLSRSGSTLHALVCLCQCPQLAGEVGATNEMWLVIVRSAVKNVQTHAGAPKLRRQPDLIAALRGQNIPELAREVTAFDEVRLIVLGAAIENVQAHTGAAK